MSLKSLVFILLACFFLVDGRKHHHHHHHHKNKLGSLIGDRKGFVHFPIGINENVKDPSFESSMIETSHKANESSADKYPSTSASLVS